MRQCNWFHILGATGATRTAGVSGFPSARATGAADSAGVYGFRTGATGTARREGMLTIYILYQIKCFCIHIIYA